MQIVHVHVHVKPDYIEAFIAATQENARKSVMEPGVARFDVIQQADDPTWFVLVEVYRTLDAPGKHKDTIHYKTWRNAVNEMMMDPRGSVRYTNIFPEDANW